MTLAEKLQTAIMGVAGLFVAGGMIFAFGYQAGKPWNCEQAKEILEKERQMQVRIGAKALNRNDTGAAMGAVNAYYEAESKMLKLCHGNKR